jgi:hypothetical protein
VCKRMMDAIARFWWGRDDKSNKMHWYAWWKLCCPKREREWYGVQRFSLL